ncbi:MAG: hypothetical protein FJ319_09585 [SAR202 cluster bacterium]|nr:hypothetical protein [SAR202 cluster bacterium]
MYGRRLSRLLNGGTSRLIVVAAACAAVAAAGCATPTAAALRTVPLETPAADAASAYNVTNTYVFFVHPPVAPVVDSAASAGAAASPLPEGGEHSKIVGIGQPDTVPPSRLDMSSA